MKRPVKLLLFLCLVRICIWGFGLVFGRVWGRARLALWPGSLPDRAGGARGHRGAQRSRSDAAGALDAGHRPPGWSGGLGMGVPGSRRGGGARAGLGWRTGAAW